MRVPHSRLVMICLAAFAAGRGSSQPEFVGVMTSQGTTHLAVRGDETASATWVRVGDALGDYRVAAYEAQDEILVLTRGATELRLLLKGAAVKSAPLTVDGFLYEDDGALKRELQQLRQLEAQRSKTAAELAQLETRGASDRGARENVARVRHQLLIDEHNLNNLLRALVDFRRANPAAPK